MKFTKRFEFSDSNAGNGTIITSQLTPVSLTITNGGATTLTVANSYFKNFYTTSGATTTTITYSNIPNGGTVTIDYLKTTATNMVMTFPAGSVVSASSDATVTGAGLIATLASTTSGRFTIQIMNINSVYKVYISNDVA